MLDEQKFGSSILGGFKKENVINYINDLVRDHANELEILKKDCELKNEKVAKELQEARVLCDSYKKKLEEFEDLFKSYKEKIGAVLNEKDEVLKQKDETIFNMAERIKALEKDIATFKSLNKSDEYKIKRAEYIAKERVSQIVNKGKDEYKKQMDAYKNEKDLLKKNAYREASQILNSAASRVSKFNNEVKDELKKLYDVSIENAKNIISCAKIVAQRMLNDASKAVLEKYEDLNLEDFSVLEKFDIDGISKKVDEEVFKAMEGLKDLEIFKDVPVTKPVVTPKKHRRLILDISRRRNKE